MNLTKTLNFRDEFGLPLELNDGTGNARWVVDVRGWDEARLFGTTRGGFTWGTAVLKLFASHDGVAKLPLGVTLGPMTADGVLSTSDIDVQTVNYLIIELFTAEGSPSWAELELRLSKTSDRP